MHWRLCHETIYGENTLVLAIGQCMEMDGKKRKVNNYSKQNASTWDQRKSNLFRERIFARLLIWTCMKKDDILKHKGPK